MWANPQLRTRRLNGSQWTEYWAWWPFRYARHDYGHELVWLTRYYSRCTRSGRVQYYSRDDFKLISMQGGF